MAEVRATLPAASVNVPSEHCGTCARWHDLQRVAICRCPFDVTYPATDAVDLRNEPWLSDEEHARPVAA